MRVPIEQEKPARDIWDLKLIPGGLIDMEFIARYRALVAPSRGHRVHTNEPSTTEALKALGALIDPNDLDTCLAALTLYTDLSQVIRLCIGGPFDPASVPAGLTDRVAPAAETPDVKAVKAEVRRLSKMVWKVVSRLVAA